MRFSLLFFSFITWIFCLLIAFFGFFLILLSAFLDVRVSLINLLIYNSNSLTMIGLTLLLSGILLFFISYFIGRKRFLDVEMNHKARISIRPKTIEKFCSAYFDEILPKYKVKSKVLIENQKINIFANIPRLSFDQYEEVLATIEKELSLKLKTLFGYDKEFIFSLKVK